MEVGASVPPFYDSMIAKLIVHAADRPSAVARLRDALEQFQISGLATNLRLLRAIVGHRDFIEGRFDTRWKPFSCPASSREGIAELAHIEFLDETMRDGQQSLWGMRMRPAWRCRSLR